MLAMIFIMAPNNNLWGPNILAISVSKATKYAYKLVLWGPIMLAITEIVLEERAYDFWTNHEKTNFQCLQAYLVPIE